MISGTRSVYFLYVVGSMIFARATQYAGIAGLLSGFLVSGFSRTDTKRRGPPAVRVLRQCNRHRAEPTKPLMRGGPVRSSVATRLIIVCTILMILAMPVAGYAQEAVLSGTVTDAT